MNDDSLRSEDLKIGIYRVGSRNAVRIVHLPTGLAVTVNAHKSELQNKDEAIAILRRRVAWAKYPPTEGVA